MIIRLFDDKSGLSKAAADHAANVIRRAIREHDKARIIVATGSSQLEFLDALAQARSIDWQRVEMFHLDEYIGLPMTHPASFRKYLTDRLISRVGIKQHHLIAGDGDAAQSMRSVGEALRSAPIDIAFVGIGENGHLAFNDPPADFNTDEAYLIVSLDEACRRQQVGEGWFANISQVPRKAISMSVQQILKANEIIAVVPDSRKARAVSQCLEGEINPLVPASILRKHPHTTMYLDQYSAALLSPEFRSAAKSADSRS